MAQPPRNDVRSHDWSMAVVGGFITLIIAALFFRQLTVETCSLVLYWLWSIADFPRTHEFAAWCRYRCKTGPPADVNLTHLG